jgi:hypothetical protein
MAVETRATKLRHGAVDGGRRGGPLDRDRVEPRACQQLAGREVEGAMPEARRTYVPAMV